MSATRGGVGRAARLGTAWLWLAAGSAGAQASAEPALQEPPAVLLVGDSTMAPQTGYGNALCERLQPAVACLNLARGGRSTLSYRAEGLWDRVLARLKAGSPGVTRHVLIQFGHNDQPGKPGRSTDLEREFSANLARYVTEARAAGGVPVLVTPLTRRSFSFGRLNTDLTPWAAAVREVARAQAVPLIDLHATSAAAVQTMGSAQADLLAQGPVGSPVFDRTHLGPRGACLFADQVLAALGPALGGLPGLGSAPDCAALPPPALPPMPTTLNRATFDHPGWAVGTMGGRGGRVLKVSNLNASGPGSLREALEATGPRLVVFEVGGVIDLGGQSLALRHPFITVAGQTAPSPGITLIKGELNIATHDVIVQHLMFRPGAYGRAKRSGKDHDGITTSGGARQVIVDHCSLSWATDENLSVGGPRFDGADPVAWRRATSHEITYSHNLIYEGLGDSVHEKGEHSKGTLVHDNASGVLLYGNLYASNRERNALFKGGVQAAVVNNLIYNPGAKAVHYNLVAHEWAQQPYQTGRLTLVANAMRHGPDTVPGTALFALGGHGDLELHLDGNIAVDREGRSVAQTSRYTSGSARILKADTPALPPRLTWLAAERLEAELSLAAGARPWDRDPIDFKLLSDVAEDRGRIPDSETESSGFPRGPRYAPTARPFDALQWNLADMSPRAGWASLFR
jgi:lysophospholipase L1-like esterase